MDTLRAPPNLASGTGYPLLSAPDPPKYGVLNPRPTAQNIQANSTGLPSGTLFGEFVSTAADASLFQRNVAPDVITVALYVPNAYFGRSNTELHVPAGTTIMLAKSDLTTPRQRLRRDKNRGRTEDVGALHDCVLGNFINMQDRSLWSPEEQETVEKIRLASTFATVIVGPAHVKKGVVAFVAVALQNVAHVSYANIGDLGKAKTHEIGTHMYLGCEANKLPAVQRAAFADGVQREVRTVLPLTVPMLGTASFDIGALIAPR